MREPGATRRGAVGAALVVALVLGNGCAPMRAPHQSAAEDALLIVDCLLPPRIVSEPNLGVVAMPRPAAKTTAADCREQGGDYRVSDARWSLSVWMPAAERGDADAQYHVGEIFEVGLEVGPDFGAAAPWYRRAAEQNHRSAAANLARLYELGHGVPRDWAEALRWSLVASATDDPAVALAQSRAFLDRLERRKQELREEVERRRREGAGRQHRSQANPSEPSQASAPCAASVAQAGAADDRAERRVDELLEELRALEAQSPQLRAKIATLLKQVAGAAENPAPAPAGAVDPALVRRALGKFFALVIGDENYREWPRLATPINDAVALAGILERRYGFEKPVRLVKDGNAQEILEQLDGARRDVNREAEAGTVVSFLLFYAGHGARRYPIRGHWIPVDAPREYSSRWIADTQIAEQVRAMKARQVLVVADSCYASTLAARGVLIEDRSPSLETLMRTRPRLVLSSGGDSPVYEPRGAEHSVFARALLDVLSQSRGVVRGEELFNQIEPRVRRDAALLGVDQQPQYLPILEADHQSGDFVLVASD
jgi:hypothetical protein